MNKIFDINENQIKLVIWKSGLHQAILFLFSQFMSTIYNMCNSVNNYIHNGDLGELIIVRYSFLALSFVHRLERLFDLNQANEAAHYFEKYKHDINIYKTYIDISFKLFSRDMLKQMLEKTENFVLIKEMNETCGFDFRNVSFTH